MIKKIALMLGSASLLVLTGCGTAAAPDQFGLSYDAGPFVGTEYQGCFKPGEREVDGPFDQQFLYPAGERTFEFTGGEMAESVPLQALSSDNIQMTVSGVVTFELNTNCDTLRAFHEDIGLKYGASSDGLSDWNGLLGVYLGQPLQRAVNVAVGGYDWKTQAYDAAGTVRTDLEARVRTELPNFIAGVGDAEDFFVIRSVTLQKPVPPQQLIDQLRDQQVEAEKVNTINSRQAALNAERGQNQALIDQLGVEGYLAYRNLENCEDGDDATQCIPMFPGSSVVQQLPN